MSKSAGSRPSDRTPPTIENRKVFVRRANTAYRSREYLSDKEVTALMMAAARLGRHGARDAALILIAYRHGLRVSELVSLRWDQLDLQQGLLHVSRLKHGIASVHPVRGPELRALRRLQRDDPKMAYVFVSMNAARSPYSPMPGVRKIIGRAGREAGNRTSVHSAHAAPCHRLQIGTMTASATHEGDPALSGPPEYRAVTGRCAATPNWRQADSEIFGPTEHHHPDSDDCLTDDIDSWRNFRRFGLTPPDKHRRDHNSMIFHIESFE